MGAAIWTSAESQPSGATVARRSTSWPDRHGRPCRECRLIGEPWRHALRLDLTCDNLGRTLADRESAKERKRNKRNTPRKANSPYPSMPPFPLPAWGSRSYDQPGAKPSYGSSSSTALCFFSFTASVYPPPSSAMDSPIKQQGRVLSSETNLCSR